MSGKDTGAGQRSLWLNLSHWRNVRHQREIVAIGLFVFIADMIIGMISPTLALFARSLGASLTLVGVLTATIGIARLGSGLVVGSISDRRSRKTVLLAGMLCLTFAALLYSLITSPYLLLAIHPILGLGFISTLTVGIAYGTDVVSPHNRSLAVGLTATMMGLGYAIGSQLGGTIAGLAGYAMNYRVAAVMALAGFFVAWRSVPDERHRPEREVQTQGTFRWQISVMLADPMILTASLGSILSNLVFGGLIVAFFPIYANSFGISQVTIGTMFATRALASTLARLPAGALSTTFGSHRLMLVALMTAMGVAFAMPHLAHPVVLTILLVIEGIAYGVFLTSGQSTIARYAGESSRGAGLGLYSAAASAGDSVIPLFLGIVADAWGIRTVFYVVGGLVVLGLVAIVRILARRPPNTIQINMTM